MKTGIILKFHIAGLPVEAFGVYSEEDGIILDGNIQLGVEGDLRSTLESLLGKVGCTVSLSFFPQITVERIWMTYRNNLNEMSFGLKLKDNDKELGRIQTFLKNKEVSICF